MPSHDLKSLLEHPRLSGMSYHELQARVSAIAQADSEWASRSGKRGKWLVSNSGVEVLIRLRELEGAGNSVGSAIEVIQDELRETSSHEQSPARLQGEVEEMLLERLAEQKQRIDDLERERDRLLGLLETLAPALPRPRNEQKRQLFRWPWNRPRQS